MYTQKGFKVNFFKFIMRAYICAGSIKVRLNEKDKKRLIQRKKIRATSIEGDSSKIELRLAEYVARDLFGVPGFSVDYSERDKKYTAWISKERFQELTQPKDPESGGYFGFRAHRKFDRVDLFYQENDPYANAISGRIKFLKDRLWNIYCGKLSSFK